MKYVDQSIITLDNVVSKLKSKNPIKKYRVYGANTVSKYRLLEAIRIRLSDGKVILIPIEFEWDLSSVPKFMHWLLSLDNDAEIAYLIHDYLYKTKRKSKKFADDEMFLWAQKVNSTSKWYAAKNIDNKLRYLAVKYFGNSSYYKN